MKNKYLVYIVQFGTVSSNSDDMLPWPQHKGLYQVPGGGRTSLDQEVGCWKTLCLVTERCAVPRKQENPVLAVGKFLRTHHPEHLDT